MFNTFPLVHVDGVYRNQVADKPDVRPFILTRSAFGGIQRDSAAVWSGDVASRWDNLRDQISAGRQLLDVRRARTGATTSAASRTRTATPIAKGKDLDEWRELNTRWFQFGAFSPLFRSHGEYPFREIYADLAAKARRPTGRWNITTSSATG